MSTGDSGASAPDELLAAALAAREEAQHLDQRIESARDRAARAAEEVRALAARLTEEERDVTRLETLSWSRTLSTLRGSRASDLEREQAERDAVRYELGVAEARAETDRRELESLRARRQELGDVDGAHAAALTAKEEWVVGRDPSTGQRLQEIAAERAALSVEAREGREALEAGETAHRSLASAARQLADARTWSGWDTFGGGGLFTDMVKYDKLDKVGRDLQRTDGALRRFDQELSDVHLPALGALDISGLTTTLDVWFDNIFSDWAVRERIIQAQQRVDHALTKVQQVLDRLSARGREIEQRLAVLTSERERLLAG